VRANTDARSRRHGRQEVTTVVSSASRMSPFVRTRYPAGPRSRWSECRKPRPRG
jgi:hypothetical protein